MRASVHCLPIGAATACLLAGCGGEVAGPYTDVALRVTPQSFIIDTAMGPPASATVVLANTGAGTVTVRLCNLPAPNLPVAPLVLQEQAPDSSWGDVVPWLICPDPSDGSNQLVGPRSEVDVGRLYPANHTGRFRYQLDYTVDDGSSGTVTSDPFTVTII